MRCCFQKVPPAATQPTDCHGVDFPPESFPEFFGDFFDNVIVDHASVDMRKNKSFLAAA